MTSNLKKHCILKRSHLLIIMKMYTVNPLKFVIMSICTKTSGSCNLSLTVPCYSLGKNTFWIFVRIAKAILSNKYTKCMIYKKTVKNIHYSCFRRVHIKFLYNIKFDFTAKSLLINTVAITRVLCIILQTKAHECSPFTTFRV